MTPTTQQIDMDLADRFNGGSCDKFVCYEAGRQCQPCKGFCGRGCGAQSFTWSPSTSRDDCAEVLARLTDHVTRSLVIGNLETIVTTAKYDPMSESDVWCLVTATPAQIALAVWRATCQK